MNALPIHLQPRLIEKVAKYSQLKVRIYSEVEEPNLQLYVGSGQHSLPATFLSPQEIRVLLKPQMDKMSNSVCILSLNNVRQHIYVRYDLHCGSCFKNLHTYSQIKTCLSVTLEYSQDKMLLVLDLTYMRAVSHTNRFFHHFGMEHEDIFPKTCSPIKYLS